MDFISLYIQCFQRETSEIGVMHAHANEFKHCLSDFRRPTHYAMANSTHGINMNIAME